MHRARRRSDEESAALPKRNVRAPCRCRCYILCNPCSLRGSFHLRSANQKAARDAAATVERLEQELSALKSSCSSLEAEVASQRRLAESSSEAADAAAAHAHSTLTQHIALKKKMKAELPQLADEIATARAERDAAVRQREAEAAAIAVERSMMGSKLAGATLLPLFLQLHLPHFPTAACTSQTNAAVSRAGLLQQQCEYVPVPATAANSAHGTLIPRAGICLLSSISSSVTSSLPLLLHRVPPPHNPQFPTAPSTFVSAVPD
jgi:hypothetical protein